MSLERRLGKFCVARPLIDEAPEMVMHVMARCVIVDCNLHYIGNRFEYWAISPDFDEIAAGEIPPEYSVLIEEIDEKFKVSFKRMSA